MLQLNRNAVLLLKSDITTFVLRWMGNDAHVVIALGLETFRPKPGPNEINFGAGLRGCVVVIIVAN
jgi:hypothetical protein